MSQVDERLIRFHLAMQDQERQRREHARRRSQRTAPYVGALSAILIAGVILGVTVANGGLIVASLALLLAVGAFAKTTEEPRLSRVGVVRQASLQVLAVECPECHAPTGQRCTLPALDVRICHEARGRFYWQAADRLAYADTEEPQR